MDSMSSNITLLSSPRSSLVSSFFSSPSILHPWSAFHFSILARYHHVVQEPKRSNRHSSTGLLGTLNRVGHAVVDGWDDGSNGQTLLTWRKLEGKDVARRGTCPALLSCS